MNGLCTDCQVYFPMPPDFGEGVPYACPQCSGLLIPFDESTAEAGATGPAGASADAATNTAPASPSPPAGAPASNTMVTRLPDPPQPPSTQAEPQAEAASVPSLPPVPVLWFHPKVSPEVAKAREAKAARIAAAAPSPETAPASSPPDAAASAFSMSGAGAGSAVEDLSGLSKLAELGAAKAPPPPAAFKADAASTGAPSAVDQDSVAPEPPSVLNPEPPLQEQTGSSSYVMTGAGSTDSNEFGGSREEIKLGKSPKAGDGPAGEKPALDEEAFFKGATGEAALPPTNAASPKPKVRTASVKPLKSGFGFGRAAAVVLLLGGLGLGVAFLRPSWLGIVAELPDSGAAVGVPAASGSGLVVNPDPTEASGVEAAPRGPVAPVGTVDPVNPVEPVEPAVVEVGAKVEPDSAPVAVPVAEGGKENVAAEAEAADQEAAPSAAELKRAARKQKAEERAQALEERRAAKKRLAAERKAARALAAQKAAERKATARMQADKKAAERKAAAHALAVKRAAAEKAAAQSKVNGQAAAAAATPAPADPKAQARDHVRAGNSFIRGGKVKQAVSEYEKAILLDGRSASAHRGLGVAYATMRRPQEAVREYELYLKLSPKAADADQVRKLVDSYYASKKSN